MKFLAVLFLVFGKFFRVGSPSVPQSLGRKDKFSVKVKVFLIQNPSCY